MTVISDTMTLRHDIAAKQATAQTWFRALRDRIFAAFETIEADVQGPNAHLPAGRFEITPWDRAAGGGGVAQAASARVTSVSRVGSLIIAGSPVSVCAAFRSYAVVRAVTVEMLQCSVGDRRRSAGIENSRPITVRAYR